ncbi:OLC1v1001325C1 [Oldenlandia corymbosa var. corymbosa]|uniref:OLC1v1001325C1 n=1 Tax=Oldenlandia corymbosa var. corymbosa TaxID=529605 RepID=A0AAV1D7A9_OLDCO|nr:OLC1v1001325C1 [Oldenlandia corymbosa var. corymbosa]
MEQEGTNGTYSEINGSNDTKNNKEEQHDVPLMALNHVSRLCRSVKDSVDFYTKVLGFVLIQRPQAFDFDGAWLFNYGVGIHLVQAKDEDRLPHDPDHLDPMDNHISFQCEDMKAMELKLKEFDIKCIKRTVGDEEAGAIDQLFFNDPDGFMIEICNCENVKLVPQRSIGKIKFPPGRHNPPLDLDSDGLEA